LAAPVGESAHVMVVHGARTLGHQTLDLTTDHLNRLVAEDRLGAGAEHLDPRGGVGDDHGFRRGAQKRGDRRFTLTQSVLDVLAVCDVLNRTTGSQGAPIAVELALAPFVHPLHPSVRHQQAMFDVVGFLPLERALICLVDGLAILRMNESQKVPVAGPETVCIDLEDPMDLV
jgi:hypothetical protein